MPADELSSEKKHFRGYQTPHSPIDVNIELQRGERVLGDWNRLEAGPVHINGVEVKELVRIDRGLDVAPEVDKLFANINELQIFLGKHLLQDMPTDTIDDINRKKAALYYAVGIMHQGGLLAPVTAAATVQITATTDFGPISASPEAPDVQLRELNIRTTSTGFRLQEISTQRLMAYGYNSERAGDYIEPDPGCKYIYKAQATLNVNFSENASNPTITIENTAIDFGNKMVEKSLDMRTFLQKFIDGLRNLLVGKYKVDDLAHMEPEKKIDLSPPAGSLIARQIIKEQRERAEIKGQNLEQSKDEKIDYTAPKNTK